MNDIIKFTFYYVELIGRRPDQRQEDQLRDYQSKPHEEMEAQAQMVDVDVDAGGSRQTRKDVIQTEEREFQVSLIDQVCGKESSRFPQLSLEQLDTQTME